MDRKDPVTIFLWLWVIIVMAAYVRQFEAFVVPILNLVGLS